MRCPSITLIAIHKQMPYHKKNKTKKLVIIMGYTCNNNCVFCLNSGKRRILGRTTAAVLADIKNAKKRKVGYIEFIGGEPTIRSDFLLILRNAKKTGFQDIVFATNGRMLSYYDFARAVVGSGATRIIFSIHGHKADLHDNLTGSRGSFEQLREGITNLKKMRFLQIHSNTTIIKQNYKFLPDIARFLARLKIRNAEFIFVDPTYGAAHDNFKKFVPRISGVAPYARKAMDIGAAAGLRGWHLRYVPLCLFLGYEKQISELHEIKEFHTEHLAPDFKNYDVSLSRKEIARVKTKKCQRCFLYDKCEGIWKDYIRVYGDSELSPVLKK